ncbi:peptide deformylase, mitochondrial-like isoform X2 [Anneissia japonica]|nr:peptide deformylase, mitochondrial-like isoform X2 [Anneissia japonica]XP_033119605.1 peptide deformylase, mitochondrial-like isoform X2 [Anneissia japonica]
MFTKSIMLVIKAMQTPCSRFYASRTITDELITTRLWRAARHCIKAPRSKSPPYDHACQVGDPVLRMESSPVPQCSIKSKEIQNVITKMIKVLRKEKAVGIAAPQIGSAWQIIAVEFTPKHTKLWPPEVFKMREAKEFPLTVIINPKLIILDRRTLTWPEGCLSLKGFRAHVPRFYEVKVKGFDCDGKDLEWQVSGYPARILQHEIDHLNGTLYIDHMESKTFMDDEWIRWNLK